MSVFDSRNKIIKIISLAAIACSFCSCELPEKEIPTLTMLVPGEQQEGMDDVLKKVNSITYDKIGVNVDLRFIDPNVYNKKIRMKATVADENFDLSWVGYKDEFVNTFKSGVMYPLKDLIDEQAPELWNCVDSYMWEDSQINNEWYAVPNTQVCFYQYAFSVQKDLADKYGFTKEKIDSPRELEPFLEQVKNGGDVLYPICTIYGVDMWLNTKYEKVTAGMFISTESDSPKVINLWDIPEFIEAKTRMREWYQKGYIRKDINLYLGKTEQDLNENRYAVFEERWKPGEEVDNKLKFGKEYKSIMIGEPYMNNKDSTDTMLFINKYSKNKEKAIKLIYLLNTDKELYNTVVYGVEGLHYDLNKEGKVVLKANSGYNVSDEAWRFGNQFNALILEDNDDDIWEETKKMNYETRKSLISGFYFDESPVAEEILKCSIIDNEYSSVAIGSNDYMSNLGEIMAKYKEAGVDKIKAEVQRQVDEFLANKKQ